MPRRTVSFIVVCSAVAARGLWLPWYSHDGCDEPILRHTSAFAEDFHGAYVAALVLAGAAAAVMSLIAGKRGSAFPRVTALTSCAALVSAACLTGFDFLRRAIDDWVDEDRGIAIGWLGAGIYLTLAFSIVGAIAATGRAWGLRRATVGTATASAAGPVGLN